MVLTSVVNNWNLFEIRAIYCQKSKLSSKASTSKQANTRHSDRISRSAFIKASATKKGCALFFEISIAFLFFERNM